MWKKAPKAEKNHRRWETSAHGWKNAESVLVVIVFFSILGHSTMRLAEQGHAGFSAVLDRARAGEAFDGPQAVVELLHAQPMPALIAGVFFVLTFIFVATSLDSAALALSSAASKDLPVEGEPPRWHRLLWAFVLGGTALSLMYLGGLQVLQAASVVVGLPLNAVMGMMVASLMRHLTADRTP